MRTSDRFHCGKTLNFHTIRVGQQQPDCQNGTLVASGLRKTPIDLEPYASTSSISPQAWFLYLPVPFPHPRKAVSAKRLGSPQRVMHFLKLIGKKDACCQTCSEEELKAGLGVWNNRNSQVFAVLTSAVYLLGKVKVVKIRENNLFSNQALTKIKSTNYMAYWIGFVSRNWQEFPVPSWQRSALCQKDYDASFPLAGENQKRRAFHTTV